MRKFLILSIVTAIVVGGVAVYMLLGKEKSRTQEAVSDYQAVVEEQQKEGVPITGTGSMNSLLEMAANLECTISYKSDESADVMTEGTYFTSAGRMRGDFVVSTNGSDTVSSMILNGDEMYSWTEIEGEKYGMKISLADLKASKESQNMPEANEPVSLDANVKYTCKPWTNVDGSIFEPPTDTIFKDYKDIINVGMEYGTSYESPNTTIDQCALCEQVTGDGRAECKAAFSCQ